MQYKMVVLDLDGTLLNDEKEISPLNLHILERLVEQGVEIVIATGRRYRGAKGLIRSLTFPVQILANNGAVIRHSITENKMFHAYMSPESFQQIVLLGREMDMTPLVHVDHYEEDWDFLLERHHQDPVYSSYMMPEENGYRVMKDLLLYENPRATVLCYMGKGSQLVEFQELIHQRYPDQYNTHLITSVPRVGDFLEVMAKNSSKWQSIKSYAETIRILPEEIIAIGDDANDLMMVKSAGLGIAMANAIPKVQEVAKQVTSKTNNEDGVGMILREIFQLN